MSVLNQFEAAQPVDANSPAVNRPTGLPKIAYIVRREGLSAVFGSQVVKPMSQLAESGYDVRIAVLSPIGEYWRRDLRARWRRTYSDLPNSLKGRVHRLIAPPSRFRSDGFEQRSLRRWLRKQATPGEPMLVQCRNATTTNFVLSAKSRLPSIRVVFDCRGLEDEEHLYDLRQKGLAADPSSPKSVAMRETQRTAAKNSDAVFCVSHAMVDYLVRQYGISSDKCAVVPCCVDVDRFSQGAADRDAIRQSLGLPESFVVAYCGSLASYQMPEESLDQFAWISRHRPNAHFLAITTHPDRMRDVIARKSISPEKTTVVSVPHAEVPRYLGAADCGFLLRELSPVNQVASPIKFGEYLASGTPVIMSEGIGDYSDLAEQEQVGVVLPSGSTPESAAPQIKSFIDDYLAKPEDWRARCQRVAREQLDSGFFLPRVTDVYERLSRNGN